MEVENKFWRHGCWWPPVVHRATSKLQLASASVALARSYALGHRAVHIETALGLPLEYLHMRRQMRRQMRRLTEVWRSRDAPREVTGSHVFNKITTETLTARNNFQSVFSTKVIYISWMKPPGRLYKGTNINGDDFLRTYTGKLRDISFLLGVLDSLMWWGRYPPDSDGVQHVVYESLG